MVSRSQEVSTDSEQILHNTVNRREPLELSGRLETPHLALTLSGRLMGDLRAVIRVLIGAVKHLSCRRDRGPAWRRPLEIALADQIPCTGNFSSLPAGGVPPNHSFSASLSSSRIGKAPPIATASFGYSWMNSALNSSATRSGTSEAS